MYSRWTQHLNSEEDINAFKQHILSARPVLERLLQIVNEDEASLDRSEMDQRVYDSPNWAEKQAHKNGNRQYINAIRLLVDLDQQKDTRR
jgi:hypothetical protein